MANRLAFDVGLHLDCRTNGMPEQEVNIRHMVMRACTIYDKYWALFLGRPTSIKSQDIGMDLLQSAFSQLTSAFGDMQPAERDVTGEIYEQLIELMDLAGRIVETRDHHVVKNNANIDRNNVFAVGEAEDNAYLHVVNLDRQLQDLERQDLRPTQRQPVRDRRDAIGSNDQLWRQRKARHRHLNLDGLQDGPRAYEGLRKRRNQDDRPRLDRLGLHLSRIVGVVERQQGRPIVGRPAQRRHLKGNRTILIPTSA